MNESKLKRGTKYVSLKDEDVHTVTGALKQFFRELTTDLIPIEIVKNLPNDFENEDSLCQIRDQMRNIDYLPRETLKYLLTHLIRSVQPQKSLLQRDYSSICDSRVDQNSDQNLMNSTNLSIVWGACILASSYGPDHSLETSELIRNNSFFRILIQKYDHIFGDIERLI